MSAPAITALMPVLSGAEYAEKTIKSVIGQSFADWEMLIIVEPDSDAAVKHVAAGYAASDSRVFCLENKTHLGLANSLNMGIEAARGKYVARVDADDPSYPRRFEKQIGYLGNHPEIGVLGTQYRNIYPGHAVVSNLPVWPENIKASLLFECCLCHSSLMFRRDLFIANNWRYPENRPGEDYALWLYLLDKVCFANLNDVLLDRYVMRQKNISFYKRNCLTAASRLYIANALEKILGIDTKRYSLNHFWELLDNSPFADLKDLSALDLWSANCIRLMFEIERANGIKKIFDDRPLARTLKKRWNRLLDACFAFNTPNKQAAPRLTEKSAESFSLSLARAFGKRGAPFGEELTADGVTPTICKILRDCVEEHLKILLALTCKIPKVIVFGIGYCCHRFFEDMPEAEKYFEILYFCDNNLSGKSRAPRGKPCVLPPELSDIDFDYILIATRDYFSEISAQLINYEIPPEKILPLEMFRLVKTDLFSSFAKGNKNAC